jgi:hypothetical protein
MARIAMFRADSFSRGGIVFLVGSRSGSSVSAPKSKAVSYRVGPEALPHWENPGGWRLQAPCCQRLVSHLAISLCWRFDYSVSRKSP